VEFLKGKAMTTLTVEFEEFLTIKRALQEAVVESRHESRRGERFGNAAMALHFEEHANTLQSLIEKITGQALYK
jgi:hypothetical protein